MQALGREYTDALKHIFPDRVLSVLREYHPTMFDCQLRAINEQFSKFPLQANGYTRAWLFMDQIVYIFFFESDGSISVRVRYRSGTRVVEPYHGVVLKVNLGAREVLQITTKEFRLILGELKKGCIYCIKVTDILGTCLDCLKQWNSDSCAICGDSQGVLLKSFCCKSHLKCWLGEFGNKNVTV